MGFWIQVVVILTKLLEKKLKKVTEHFSSDMMNCSCGTRSDPISRGRLLSKISKVNEDPIIKGNNNYIKSFLVFI